MFEGLFIVATVMILSVAACHNPFVFIGFVLFAFVVGAAIDHTTQKISE